MPSRPVTAQTHAEVFHVCVLQEISGQRNGSWRGGRTKHKAGYVTVKVVHPRDSNHG